jgi:cysteine-rich secretory family protein
MSFGRVRASRGALIGVVLTLAVLGAACVPGPGPAPSAGPSSGGPVGGIINAINGARGQAGLPGLAVDGGLNGTAQFHADRLAAGGGGGCNNLWHSGELASWGAHGETVACVLPCTGDGGRFVSMWLGSPPHRAIVLGGFSAVGVGAACNGGSMYAVAQFR